MVVRAKYVHIALFILTAYEGVVTDLSTGAAHTSDVWTQVHCRFCSVTHNLT